MRVFAHLCNHIISVVFITRFGKIIERVVGLNNGGKGLLKSLMLVYFLYHQKMAFEQTVVDVFFLTVHII